jgi:hypothetical protein
MNGKEKSNNAAGRTGTKVAPPAAAINDTKLK